MKKTSLGLLLFFLILSVVSLRGAQTGKMDSLMKLLNKNSSDTLQVDLLNQLSGEFLDRSSFDSAQFFSKRAIKICKERLKDNSLSIEIKNSYSGKLAAAYGNMAYAHMSLDEYPKAVDNYFMALKIEQDLKNKTEIVRYWINIGVVFNAQEDYKTALEYYFKALNLLPADGSLSTGDKRRLTAILGNIGTAYRDLKELGKALEYFFKALEIADEIQFKPFQSTILGNIGIAYQKLGDSLSAKNEDGKAAENYANAKKYYLRALDLDEKIGNKNGISRHLGNLGQYFIERKNYSEAEKYLLKALAISNEIGSLKLMKDEHQSLSECYTLTGRDKESLIHYKEYIHLRDSILGQESAKKVVRAAMKFEYDKKEALLLAEQDKERELGAAENKKQRIIIIAVIGGLLLVLVFSGFIFRALRTTRKQKVTIENQKVIVEEKQTEILSSIRYAKRIQSSILPTEKYIERNLNRLRKNK